MANFPTLELDPEAERILDKVCAKIAETRAIHNWKIEYEKEKERRLQLEKMIEDLHKQTGRGVHKTPEKNMACITDAFLNKSIDTAEAIADAKEEWKKVVEISECVHCESKIINNDSDKCPRCGNEVYPVTKMVTEPLVVQDIMYMVKPHYD